MKISLAFFFFWLAALPQFLSAQGTVDAALAAHQERIEANSAVRELDRLKLKQTYKGALEQLLDSARARGDLELFVSTEAEIQRIEIAVEPPPSASTFADLARLQAILQQQLQRLDREHAGRIAQLYRQVDAALALQQQQWVREGKIEEAKDLDRRRKALLEEDASRWALGILQSSEGLPNPPAPAALRRPTDIRQVQTFFKGRVSHFNPVNLEVEVTYDFASPEQLADFKRIRGELFAVEAGRLLVRAPPGSDWWAQAKMSGPSLYAPFLDPGNMSLAVDFVELAGEGPFHLPAGISDLDKKTIAIGPISTVQSHAVEGWTPAAAELRDRSAMLPIGGAARLSVTRKGDQVDFGVISARRTANLTVPTAKELRYIGLFPKAWGAAPARAVYDNLVVKGTLSLEWMSGGAP